MENQIYQLKITLEHSKPPIWRRVLMPSNLELYDLHILIQSTMGWHNSHLNQFIIGNEYYSEKMLGDDFWDDSDQTDYRGLKVSDFLTKEKQSIRYEYDFGDSWLHKIVLEKILPKEQGVSYPICINGKNNCPPEDCGGIWGFYDMMEILQDPKHPEYEDYADWLEADYDPTYFSVEDANSSIKSYFS